MGWWGYLTNTWCLHGWVAGVTLLTRGVCMINSMTTSRLLTPSQMPTMSHVCLRLREQERLRLATKATTILVLEFARTCCGRTYSYQKPFCQRAHQLHSQVYSSEEGLLQRQCNGQISQVLLCMNALQERHPLESKFAMVTNVSAAKDINCVNYYYK